MELLFCRLPIMAMFFYCQDWLSWAQSLAFRMQLQCARAGYCTSFSGHRYAGNAICYFRASFIEQFRS